MKKSLILLTIFCFTLSVFAFDYVPKNTNINPFENKNKTEQKTEHTIPPEMREIKTLAEYFRYLPREVQRHWKPYKADKDYQVTVQFTVHKNGSISDIQIIGTNYPNANRAVIDAVKSGAPYQPLPTSFKKDYVKAQVILEYHAHL